MSQSSEEPLINGMPLEVRQTFAKWRELFHNLLDSSFWNNPDAFSGDDEKPVDYVRPINSSCDDALKMSEGE